MPVKGVYLAAAGIGSVILYSGFKGKKWTDVTHQLISGKNPTQVPQTYGITSANFAYGYGGTGIAQPGGPVSGELIAADAEQYKGAGYVWAGVPGSGAGNWDCSSFCNAVIGRDLHYGIPMYKAGTYHGQAHGPNTTVWLAWPGAYRVTTPQAGDLAIWLTHMGICLGGNQLISALNGAIGTQETTIQEAAPGLEPLVFKRMKATDVAHG